MKIVARNIDTIEILNPATEQQIRDFFKENTPKFQHAEIDEMDIEAGVKFMGFKIIQ